MSNQSEFFTNLAGQAYRSHTAIQKNRQENRAGSGKPGFVEKPVDAGAVRLLYLMLTGLIAFVGVEAVKVIYRKNFGAEGISLLRLSVCCLCLFALGLLGLVVGMAAAFGKIDARFTELDSSLSYIFTGIFYVILSIFTFGKGVIDYKTAEKNTVRIDYAGESTLLAFLGKEGWSNKAIQSVAEPVLTILTGITFALFINIPGGLPIIICGFSLWVYMLMKAVFVSNRMERKIVRGNTELSGEEIINEVVTDI